MIERISRLKYLLKKVFKLDEKLNAGLVLSAKALRNMNQANKHQILSDIQKAEFKVFSQCGDDGIIAFLVDYLNLKEKSFVEFGVENYLESNTRYLLIENNWRGLVMDGDKKNVDYIKADNIYWRYNLCAVNAFITKENINSLLKENGFEGEIGLLHIDIDGNDYWVWDSINVVQPIILILEYNSLFGSDNHYTIPYQDDFIRTNAHYSNLYFGASLPALIELSEKKGYLFIGCNSTGNNAYFIKKEHIKDIQVKSCKEGYVNSMFREGRDINGKLSILSKEDQLAIIKGLPVINTQTMKKETL